MEHPASSAAEEARVQDAVGLVALFVGFLSCALGGIGGGLFASTHRVVVDVRRWMSEAEFVDTLSLCQLMPGPNFANFSICTGAKLRGAIGAAAAFSGLCAIPMAIALSLGSLYLRCGPSSTATFVVFRLWHRFRDAPWRRIVRAGLVPLTIGLVVAGGWVLASAGDIGWRGMAITAATAGLALVTRINPLWMLAVAGLLGAVGAP